MTVREQTQEYEYRLLSPRAAKAGETLGRAVKIEECPLRTCFQRDRDRIVHSKAYRRLMHKTQVFLSPEGDHYRTRFTHTQEVSQIARTIARAMRINEDLTEAVALGHDLGHTPFGHAGERALDEIHPNGFKHSEQSVRVVELLELDGAGLNLTIEVKDGIACHSSGGRVAFTLEGRIVRLADRIAYLNHDFDDAVRAGVLTEDDLPCRVKNELGQNGSQRITSMILCIVEGGTEILEDERADGLFTEFREFMFDALYYNPHVKSEEQKAENIVKSLYEYYSVNQAKLPGEYGAIIEREGVGRAVCDYVSGMSDRFAVTMFKSLFIPKSWSF